MFKMASFDLLHFLDPSSSCWTANSPDQIWVHISGKLIYNFLEIIYCRGFCSKNMIHRMTPKEKIKLVEVWWIWRPWSFRLEMTLPLNLSLRYWLFFGVVWHRHHLASTKAGFVLQHSLLKAKLLSEEGPGKHTGSCCLQFRKGPRLYHRQGQSNT